VPEDFIRTVFEPIMKDITDLIDEQIHDAGRSVQAVLLVGGFGQNKYLRERVAASTGLGGRVLQPTDGWTAVVRGAAMPAGPPRRACRCNRGWRGIITVLVSASSLMLASTIPVKCSYEFFLLRQFQNLVMSEREY
jgi:hypothetical protein